MLVRLLINLTMARRWRDLAGATIREYGSKKERLLFHQVVRTQFLIAQGFQVLADDNSHQMHGRRYAVTHYELCGKIKSDQRCLAEQPKLP
jgi:hypothetical protein